MFRDLFKFLTLYSAVSFLSISSFEEFFEDEKFYVKHEALTLLLCKQCEGYEKPTY